MRQIVRDPTRTPVRPRPFILDSEIAGKYDTGNLGISQKFVVTRMETIEYQRKWGNCDRWELLSGCSGEGGKSDNDLAALGLHCRAGETKTDRSRFALPRSFDFGVGELTGREGDH